MRYEVALLILLVVYLLWQIYVMKTREDGICFCMQVREILKVNEEVEKIEAEDTDELITSTFYGRYFLIEYDCEKPRSYFAQMENAVMKIMKQYDKIANKEFDFTTEDWTFIRENYQLLEDLKCQLRYQKWVRGFYMTV